jgi:predicted ester cyclase
MREIYERYIALCNGHRFDLLHELIADDVRVEGVTRGVRGYIADLEAAVAVFPDLHWEIQHVVVEGEWLAAHLFDTGTQAREFRGLQPGGRSFAVPEFAFYRFDGRRIAHVWARADEASMIDQLRGDT